jgi:M6 family metalloprotease-like protein
MKKNQHDQQPTAIAIKPFRYNFPKLYLLLGLGSLILLASCYPTGEIASSCTAPVDIMNIDNSRVSQELKDRLFKSAGGYIDKRHPDYNESGKTIVIPISFSNLPRNSAVTNDRIVTDFFESGGLGNDNINTYFEKNSYGQFKLSNAGIPPTVTLPHDTSYYAENMLGRDWTRNTKLTEDICRAAAIDWRVIDRNSDKKITPNEIQFVFLYSDGGLGATRGHQFSIQTNYGTYEIRNAFSFLSCKTDNQNDKATEPISYNFVTIRHELLHSFFGLPDRYIPVLGKTGNYDPMSANRPRWTNMNIVDKVKIGWVTPKIFTNDADVNPLTPSKRMNYRFPNSANTPAALVLYNSKFPNECWFVEYRCNNCTSLANFDSGLSESGLAIWWMDLKTQKVILISAEKSGIRPEEYEDFPASGALYYYRSAESAKEMIWLKPSEGVVGFNIRNVSTPGNTICAEL